MPTWTSEKDVGTAIETYATLRKSSYLEGINEVARPA